MFRTLISLALALGAALAVYFFSDQPANIRTGLAILTLVAALWTTETFHVSVTALLVPVLAVFAGVFDLKTALASFAHPVIFLFMGGFALAAALHIQQIDARIATAIVTYARGNLRVALWFSFAATAFISMWISNTATTVMMLPLVMGLLSRFNYETHKHVYWYALLGIAYSANIGGMGTLVGSPPNAIAAANSGISFVQWLSFGVPAVVFLLPLVIATLNWRYKPRLDRNFELEQSDKPLNSSQKLTIFVFSLTVAGWLLSQPLSSLLGITSGFDSIVAILAIVLLFALRLIQWKDFQSTTNWGVLLLFGGGLSLSALLLETGASQFLGETIMGFATEIPVLLFLFALVLFVVMLTEISSNTASSALLIPVFLPVAATIAMPEKTMAAIIAIAASCAFMLPVATPPNALVFGTGKVPQQQMMSNGIKLNLIMSLLISIAAWLLITQ